MKLDDCLPTSKEDPLLQPTSREEGFMARLMKEYRHNLTDPSFREMDERRLLQLRQENLEATQAGIGER